MENIGSSSNQVSYWIRFRSRQCRCILCWVESSPIWT